MLTRHVRSVRDLFDIFEDDEASMCEGYLKSEIMPNNSVKRLDTAEAVPINGSKVGFSSQEMIELEGGRFYTCTFNMPSHQGFNRRSRNCNLRKHFVSRGNKLSR